MNKIGFIGAFDKTDFIIYLGKIFVEMGQRVLFVDATVTQKARYVVPNIQTTKAYITQFEGIDVAVGLKNFDEIRAFLSMAPNSELPYDIVMVDTSSAGGVASFRLDNSQKLFFATSMDMYSIRKGIESLSIIPSKVDATKVMFSREQSKEESEYLNYLTTGSNIQWKEEIVHFPFEMGDQTEIYRNQRDSRLRFRNLTPSFKEGLLYLAALISGEENYPNVKKAFKKLEKGV